MDNLIAKLKNLAYNYMDGNSTAEEAVQAMIDEMAEEGLFSEEQGGETE